MSTSHSRTNYPPPMQRRNLEENIYTPIRQDTHPVSDNRESVPAPNTSTTTRTMRQRASRERVSKPIFPPANPTTAPRINQLNPTHFYTILDQKKTRPPRQPLSFSLRKAAYLPLVYRKLRLGLSRYEILQKSSNRGRLTHRQTPQKYSSAVPLSFPCTLSRSSRGWSSPSPTSTTTPPLSTASCHTQ